MSAAGSAASAVWMSGRLAEGSDLMLVLTRKVGESIRIGENIVVRVLKVQGTHVQLGFDAPREVPILRAELCDRLGQQVQLHKEECDGSEKEKSENQDDKEE